MIAVKWNPHKGGTVSMHPTVCKIPNGCLVPKSLHTESDVTRTPHAMTRFCSYVDQPRQGRLTQLT